MAYEYDPENPLFRELSDAEETCFRLFALFNPPENLSHWEAYHPVCRAVWINQGFQPEKEVKE
jgi:hypothetical protein